MKINAKTVIKSLLAAGSIGIAVSGGCTAATVGYCKWRQPRCQEDADIFIRSMESGNVEKGKNDKSYEFTQSLIDNKAKIQSVINLSDEQYKVFSDIAVGIAKAETDYGLNSDYTIKKVLNAFGIKRKKIFGGVGISQGLTNIKNADLGEGERSKLDKLGVTNFFDPKQSAIATIVHLNTFSNLYTKYLTNIASRQNYPILTPEEYVLAVYNGQSLDTNDKKPEKRENAKKNITEIIQDRTAEEPTNYVWQVLRSVGYTFDSKSGKVIKQK